MGVHASLSALVEANVPVTDRVVPLDKKQAETLARATANVLRWYPQLETTQKVWDHINLMTVAATIYGPMAVVLFLRAQERRGSVVAGTSW